MSAEISSDQYLGLIDQVPHEICYLTGPVAYVYSGGRGIEIAKAVLPALTVCVRHPVFTGVIRQEPSIPLRESWIDTIVTANPEEPDTQLIRQWLQTTTEGRPLAGEWIYNASQPINTLGKDMLRIATFKLRPLFADLMTAYQYNQPHVTRLLYARDTGQVIKYKNRDILKYQSHPEPGLNSLFQQAIEIETSEYGVILTATMILGGVFPTKTPQDIYKTMSLIYGLAHGQRIDETQVPDGLHLKAHPFIHVAAFRTPDHSSFLGHELTYKPVPGGLNYTYGPVREATECLVVDGEGSTQLTTDQLTFDEFIQRGAWQPLSSHMFSHPPKWARSFDTVLCGMVPEWNLIHAVRDISLTINPHANTRHMS